jgi:hypothetical protein
MTANRGPEPEEPVSAWDWAICHYMNCWRRKPISRVEVITPDQGTVPRMVCDEHKGLLIAATKANMVIMVTPISVYGSQPVQGGTIWINTIRDFWFGQRKPGMT